MTTYTITFGEVAENGIGMEKLGEKYERGFTIKELKSIKASIQADGYDAYYLNLSKYCPEELSPSPAGLLLIKNGVELLGSSAEELLDEQEQLVYDTSKIMRGRVVNSRARYNICFADYDQEPDIPEGRGTVVSFESLPQLNKVRTGLSTYLGSMAGELYGEGNKYYDIKKCGIGYHGDTERRVVIGTRLGEPMELAYLWYYEYEPVGYRVKLTLDPGDIYVMSDKAVGYDWRRKLIATLRHSAGCNAYTKIPD